MASRAMPSSSSLTASTSPRSARPQLLPPLDTRRRLGIPAAAPLVVNAAALTGEKDHRTLIRAAHYARAQRPELHWVIAGEGRLRASLTAEIARLGLRDRVHLLGYVDRIDALIAD